MFTDHFFHFSQTGQNMDRPRETNQEKEWLEKLFGECEDEFFETFGAYDGKLLIYFLIQNLT